MVCVVPSSRGTRESRDVRGLRPNRSSKAVIFFYCRDESDMVWLVDQVSVVLRICFLLYPAHYDLLQKDIVALLRG